MTESQRYSLDELLSAYLDRELSSQQIEIVENRLRHDPEYQRRYQQYRALQRCLRQSVITDCPPELVSQLQQTICQQCAAQPPVSLWSSSIRLFNKLSNKRILLTTSALALTVLLAVGLFSLRMRLPLSREYRLEMLTTRSSGTSSDTDDSRGPLHHDGLSHPLRGLESQLKSDTSHGSTLLMSEVKTRHDTNPVQSEPTSTSALQMGSPGFYVSSLIQSPDQSRTVLPIAVEVTDIQQATNHLRQLLAPPNVPSKEARTASPKPIPTLTPANSHSGRDTTDAFAVFYAEAEPETVAAVLDRLTGQQQITGWTLRPPLELPAGVTINADGYLEGGIEELRRLLLEFESPAASESEPGLVHFDQPRSGAPVEQVPPPRRESASAAASVADRAAPSISESLSENSSALATIAGDKNQDPHERNSSPAISQKESPSARLPQRSLRRAENPYDESSSEQKHSAERPVTQPRQVRVLFLLREPHLLRARNPQRPAHGKNPSSSTPAASSPAGPSTHD